MKSGKLDEELKRISDIVQEMAKRSCPARQILRRNQRAEVSGNRQDRSSPRYSKGGSKYFS